MNQLKQRLQLLRSERDRGAQQLGILDRQRRETSETLLRIEGAIQVLEELLAKEMEASPEVAVQS